MRPRRRSKHRFCKKSRSGPPPGRRGVTKGADILSDRPTESSDKRICTAADQHRGSSLQFARVYLGRTEIFDGKFALFSLIKMAIWTNLTESDGGE